MLFVLYYGSVDVKFKFIALTFYVRLPTCGRQAQTLARDDWQPTQVFIFLKGAHCELF